MYGKIFGSMYDSTVADDWRALITFQQFIVMCDADGIVDMTPQAISRRTGIPIEHIKAGIEILEQPDKYSRTQGEDGRRIELIDDHRPWGWHIVNHAKYREMVDSATVRKQTRDRVRKHRKKKKKAREDVTDRALQDVTGNASNAIQIQIHKQIQEEKRSSRDGTNNHQGKVDENPLQVLSALFASLGVPVHLVHSPKGMGVLRDWVTQGIKPEEVQAVWQMLHDGGKRNFGPAYMVGPMEDFKAGTKDKGKNKQYPDTRLPSSDRQLESWAKKHGYPGPGVGESYDAYRGKLQAAVEKRRKERDR